MDSSSSGFDPSTMRRFLACFGQQRDAAEVHSSAPPSVVLSSPATVLKATHACAPRFSLQQHIVQMQQEIKEEPLPVFHWSNSTASCYTTRSSMCYTTRASSEYDRQYSHPYTAVTRTSTSVSTQQEPIEAPASAPAPAQTEAHMSCSGRTSVSSCSLPSGDARDSHATTSKEVASSSAPLQLQPSSALQDGDSPAAAARRLLTGHRSLNSPCRSRASMTGAQHSIVCGPIHLQPTYALGAAHSSPLPSPTCRHAASSL